MVVERAGVALLLPDGHDERRWIVSASAEGGDVNRVLQARRIAPGSDGDGFYYAVLEKAP